MKSPPSCHHAAASEKANNVGKSRKRPSAGTAKVDFERQVHHFSAANVAQKQGAGVGSSTQKKAAPTTAIEATATKQNRVTKTSTLDAARLIEATGTKRSYGGWVDCNNAKKKRKVKGTKGYYKNLSGTFKVQIYCFGKYKNFGTFPNEQEAGLAHAIAKNKLELSTFSWMVKRQNKRKAAEKKKQEMQAARDVKRQNKRKAVEKKKQETQVAKNKAKQVKKDATWHKISPNYNTTFNITRASLYFPKPVGGRETIANCKEEGWTVGIKLLVDINDRTVLFKLKQEAVKLGMTVDQMMIILKDLMENCLATICIESDIHKNTAIQKVANKMKTIMGGSAKTHSLSNNCNQVIACHANFGRGKIEGKYDIVTTKYYPRTMGVACSLLRTPEPKMVEGVATEVVTPKSVSVAPESKVVEAKAKAVEAKAVESKAVGPESKVVEAPPKLSKPKPKLSKPNRRTKDSLRDMLISTAVPPYLISYPRMILLWNIISVIVIFWLVVFISKQDFRWYTQQKFTLIIKFSIH